MESELIAILDPLINLLDGSLDFYSPEEVKDFEKQMQDNDGDASFQPTIVRTEAMKELRYKRSIDNDVVMDIKGKILDILALVMNMHDDKRLTIFLTEFHSYCK
jgi:hypothetical protein